MNNLSRQRGRSAEFQCASPCHSATLKRGLQGGCSGTVTLYLLVECPVTFRQLNFVKHWKTNVMKSLGCGGTCLHLPALAFELDDAEEVEGQSNDDLILTATTFSMESRSHGSDKTLRHLVQVYPANFAVSVSA
jgi:hypothetical protein